MNCRHVGERNPERIMEEILGDSNGWNVLQLMLKI
jgi:hypothetical protein